MSKYEAVTTLRLTKARADRTCDSCGSTIEKGKDYFRESLGRHMKPPGIKLRSFCSKCRGMRGSDNNK